MTVVVTNAQVTTRSINNWNYVRGYIAFDDILLTVNFSVDPALVKEITHSHA